ncbi:hypothetical protein AB0D74_43180 [Streptomyces sp. NPDC048278]|uniref:hypothetical protein n=1 Tax=Streptomyces sp. NPDC048278 TaxID=3155809 RepID=UPI003438CA45
MSKLMALSQCGEAQHRKVEILVDLMVTVGMLRPEDGGYLRWVEGATVPKQRVGSRPPATGTGAADSTVTDVRAEPAVAEPKPEAPVPSPRPPAEDSTREDLIRLLSPPVLLTDLARLSAEDMLALHGHLHGLASILAKLRGPSMT